MTPNFDQRSAARILDLADPALRPRRPRALAAGALFLAISAFCAHGVASRGSPDAARAAEMSPAGATNAHAESPEMKQMLSRLSVAGAIAVGSSALAQDAVQWRVEDGGNGHWYRFNPSKMPFDWHNQHAFGEGGFLVSIADAPENTFVYELARDSGGTGSDLSSWIGFVQSTNGMEPDQGWSWTDNTPLTWTNWGGGEPNNFGSAGEDRCRIIVNSGFPSAEAKWQDYPETSAFAAIIEWSADCNADGIVDYGQIRAGELEDTNANNIPDCCEYSGACEGNVTVDLVAHYPFDGNCLDASGFGRHGAPTAITFDEDAAGRPARAAAFNGINSQMLVDGIPIPTNNAFTWALWIRCEAIGNPISGTPILERIEAVGNNLVSPSLFVRTNGGLGFGSYSFASGGSSVETAASTISAGVWVHIACTSGASGLRRVYLNGTIIGEGNSPEYGEALGRLLVGRDRIDCCGMFRGSMDDLRIYSRALTGLEIRTLIEIGQPPACPADISGNGTVDAVDLAAVLSSWGNAPTGKTNADVNRDGVVNAVDLAEVLGAWGACP